MKKIFTLISMALVAMSVNAQEAEIWDVSTEANQSIINTSIANPTKNKSVAYSIPQDTKQFPEGTYPDNLGDVTAWLEAQPDPAAYAIEMNEYVFTSGTANVTIKGVSTPNTDNTAAQAWESNTTANLKLNGGNELGFPEFTTFIKPASGNPSVAHYEFYDTNSDGAPVFRANGDISWTEGCGKLPQKGCYYEFTAAKAGTLIVGMRLNQNLVNNPLYIIDESTAAQGYKLVAKDKISIMGFRQNNNFEKEQGSTTTFVEYTLHDDYKVTPFNYNGGTNRPLFAYVVWEVAANTTYMMLGPSCQLGLYGFYFQPDAADAISTVKADIQAADAPIYNLSGQQVSKEYKGVVIQNGVKRIQK